MTSHQPTIGVSCGHRVPRQPTIVDGRRLYWCPTCSEHRMSGGKTTGENGHAYLFQMLQLVDDVSPIEFAFTAEPPEHVRALLTTMGVRVIVDAGDPQAPRVRSVRMKVWLLSCDHTAELTAADRDDQAEVQQIRDLMQQGDVVRLVEDRVEPGRAR